MGDVNDDLLALFGGGGDEEPKASPRPAKKRASAQPEAREAKKRKRATPPDSDSDMDLSSGDEDVKPSGGGDDAPLDDDMDDLAHPYPLAGLYKDAQDRAALDELPEIKREAILAERQEEVQKREDRLALRRMMEAQTGGSSSRTKGIGAGGTGRKVTATGVTKEKTRGLEDLKKRRQAKEEHQAAVANGRGRPKPSDSPRRSRSPSAMSTDSEEGEVGTYTDKQDAREREEVMVQPEDLKRIVIPRGRIMEIWPLEWFPDFIKGAWIRYVAPPDPNIRGARYRLLQVREAVKTDNPYLIEGTRCDIKLVAMYGNFENRCEIDKISNSPFTTEEYHRLRATLQGNKVRPPTSKVVESTFLRQKNWDRNLTDAEITFIAHKRKELNPTDYLTKTDFLDLRSQRTVASQQGQTDVLRKIDERFKKDAEVRQIALTGIEDRSARMAEVNARNRQANLGSMRRTGSGLAIMGTPGKVPTMDDRRKVPVPGGSAGMTPNRTSNSDSPAPNQATALPSAASQAAQIKATGSMSKFDEMVAARAQIDLGDF